MLPLPPCPFRQLTGLLCPGCGATRATIALLHGKLALAWSSNPLFLALLPLLAVYLAVAGARALRAHPHPWPSVSNNVITALLLTAAGFAVLRNL